MSFAGDLEQLPIVDVIQLLHSTKKTGTLYLRSKKGESRLAFNDGNIISAHHIHKSIRTGRILVEMGAISQEQLEQTLKHQAVSAAPERKPLVASLIENGLIDRKTALSALETFIELVIVEVLTWESGTFQLSVDTPVVSTDFSYFPELLKRNNTQNILMDALRMYDEKLHDGTLHDEIFTPSPDEPLDEEILDVSTEITADLLGLDNLDKLEKKIPGVFSGIKEYDVTEIHREKLRRCFKNLSRPEYERLLALLLEFPETKSSGGQKSKPSSPLAAVILSADAFIAHLITTICRHEGISAFCTDDEKNLDIIIDQSFSKELVPFIIFDAPLAQDCLFSASKITKLLRQKHEKYPRTIIFQLAAPGDNVFSLAALKAGAHCLPVRPITPDHPDPAFADAVEIFLRTFQSNLRAIGPGIDQYVFSAFKECIRGLDGLNKIPEAAHSVLKFASTMFERTITFVVGNNELIAEKSFGTGKNKTPGPTPPLLFTIPLKKPSIFVDVIQSDGYFYGHIDDLVIREHLHSQIGAPLDSKIFIMPIKTFGKIIALIYGDFGNMVGLPVQSDLLDMAARCAGLTLDVNFYHRRLSNGGTASNSTHINEG